ncbi:2-dehydropantoate 2-reductase [Halomonas sp. McH1-25]|uniref:ketopantoate reductase family protein n=1 Tax=unclassified Halomonas TaxID=2609666 RepID=UPI001EF589FF|nr:MULTISPECIES: 2-dehydropantoate 2-reductase [unclassified Halomonas]MCG7598191.1 2-dehydropantoate 2-reductase [Halomonas sp. McH1-25]MCP1341026.1 2-dehydropantoate 2-reductase [Halomonas sp. FL8]MCP1360911.1 2-dehydropantoate 2-reductase [Halomonas sp. BBD45]MCP1365606.1 2-dehydropantoate 2-reductase [Halomonas sp. BBD48]
MSNGTWLILGPGALGRLLAVQLAGHVPLAVIGRQASEQPFMQSTPEGESRIRYVPRLSLEQVPQRPLMVHITTKTHAVDEALDRLAQRIDDDTPIVLWQNGFQVQEPVTRRWPGPVLCATTSEGAYTEGMDSVVHAGHGQTYIGHLDGRYPALAECIAVTLTVAGLHAEPCSDIRRRLWHKLAVNAAINPLVARYRIRNGQLRDPPYRAMVEAIIDDLATLMDAEGIDAPDAGWSHHVWSVIGATANNRASMLQDVIAGRPTERDAILGPLLDAAQRHGMPTPTLTELYRNTPG